MNKTLSLVFLLSAFVFFSFTSEDTKSTSTLVSPYDSISTYVDQYCRHDTCRLLDSKIHREVFYKKLNDGRTIVVFDFWKNVTILHESKGEWVLVDQIKWDFVSSFVEFKKFNADKYDDLVIYGELDEFGNSKAYVYLYNPEHEHIEHFPSYDLLNFDYDIKLDIYKSAHYSGIHKEAYQSIYKLQNDSLQMIEHIQRTSDNDVLLIKKTVTSLDTTKVENSEILWKAFGGTTWNY